MSFGDDAKASPIMNMFQAVGSKFDAVLGPAFGQGPNPYARGAKPTPKSSLVTSTPAKIDPTPADTPGRHKSLLGA